MKQVAKREGIKWMTWQLAGMPARAVRTARHCVQDVALRPKASQGKQHALLQVNSLLVAHSF